MFSRRDFINGCAAIVPCIYSATTVEKRTRIKKDILDEVILISVVPVCTSFIDSLLFTKEQLQKHHFFVYIAPALYFRMQLYDFLVASDTEQQRQSYLKHIASILGFPDAVEITALDNILIMYNGAKSVVTTEHVSYCRKIPVLEDAVVDVCHWRGVSIGIKIRGDIKDTSDLLNYAHNATFERDGYKWIISDYEFYNCTSPHYVMS
jgi:hypothetical protein